MSERIDHRSTSNRLRPPRCWRTVFAALALSLAGCDEEGYDFFNLEDPEQAYGTPTPSAPQTQTGTPTSGQVLSWSAPSVPPGFFISCPTSPLEPFESGYCPVLQWDGVTYWAFTRLDGLQGIQVVAFDDTTGDQLGSWRKQGTSHVYDIVVDLDEQRAEFWGIDGTFARIRFSELRVY